MTLLPFTIAVFIAALLSAGCPSPQAGQEGPGTIARPQSALSTVVFRTPGAPQMPDGLAEFLAANAAWKGARLFAPSDAGNDYDRAWFAKMGYGSVVEEDLQNDGLQDIAATIVKDGRTFVVIIAPDPVGGWREAFREEIPGGRAMLRLEALAGSQSRCLLVAGAQRGYRMSVCWDGSRFLKITL